METSAGSLVGKSAPAWHLRDHPSVRIAAARAALCEMTGGVVRMIGPRNVGHSFGSPALWWRAGIHDLSQQDYLGENALCWITTGRGCTRTGRALSLTPCGGRHRHRRVDAVPAFGEPPSSRRTRSWVAEVAEEQPRLRLAEQGQQLLPPSPPPSLSGAKWGLDQCSNTLRLAIRCRTFFNFPHTQSWRVLFFPFLSCLARQVWFEMLILDRVSIKHQVYKISWPELFQGHFALEKQQP